MPAGAPSSYRAEYPQQVVEFCQGGLSLTSFAAKIGVARSTINDWCAAHPEFAEACARAKAQLGHWWEQQGVKVAQNGGQGGQTPMIIFGLKNHAPEDYKDMASVKHEGNVQMTLEHLIASSIAPPTIEHEPAAVQHDAKAKGDASE